MICNEALTIQPTTLLCALLSRRLYLGFQCRDYQGAGNCADSRNCRYRFHCSRCSVIFGENP